MFFDQSLLYLLALWISSENISGKTTSLIKFALIDSSKYAKRTNYQHLASDRLLLASIASNILNTTR